MGTTVEVCEAEVVGTFTVPDGQGPHPGVVALSGSGGGVRSWFGVDLTGGVADASARSSWTLGDQPVPFVPPVRGVGFERTSRGLSSVGIYAAALVQVDAVAAAAIPVERLVGPLLLLSGGEDA